MPPKTINDAPNPEYTSWNLQDQLIMSAIYSSLTYTVLSHILDCTTSRQIWQTLHGLCLAQSTAHLMHTKFQLATLKKGFDSISMYFHKAKALSASLNAAGHPLPESKFIINLLTGLGTDFELVVSSITTRPGPLSTSQVYSFLVNHESRLNHQTQSLLSTASFSANSTTTRSTNQFSTTPPNRSRGCGFRRGQGGHSFNPISPNFFPPQHTNCPTDTAASTHFTSDFSKLNLDSSPYQGPDQVTIGDGSSLAIQNSGSGLLPTASGKFLIRQLLHDLHSQEVLLQGPVKNGLYVLPDN
ncbi:hypothetical protein F2P56_001555 [Juglans regia]|uniref:Retrovirus-related Pol polyprotein from transposon RE1 n=1 Tax=Juglans regia TaxID=51240 RepID=A0A833YDY1_JUGRE|nr:hypothetical protein F2P56_001555 [Juglans regia]